MPKLAVSGLALINHHLTPDRAEIKDSIDCKLPGNVNFLTKICSAIKSFVFLTKFAFRCKKR